MLKIEMPDTLEILTDQNTKLAQQARMGKSPRHESGFVSIPKEHYFVMKRLPTPRKRANPKEVAQVLFATLLGLSIGVAVFLFQ